MSTERAQRIQREFWPKGEGQYVFAVLDGARNRRIYSALVNTYQETACLYRGDLAPAVEAAAPHLVRLEPDEALTTLLLEEGWDDHWGIFFYCDDSFDRIRSHLRHFLRVQDEAGKNLVFRFYDPRVLRAFLPTCKTDELEKFFGDIGKFWVPARNPDEMLEFSLDRGHNLKKRSIDLLVPAPPL